MDDPMIGSAGTLSFYGRLHAYVRAVTPWLGKTRAHDRVVDQTIAWLDSELLPVPHRSREINAIMAFHHRHGTHNSFYDSVIIAALQAIAPPR